MVYTLKSEIAATAAALVVEEGLEYGPAKRRAVKQMGLPARTELPDNDILDNAVREYIAVFCADTQPFELAALRELALVWGPVAGYAIKQDHLPLTARFIESEPGAPRLDYRIAMGVRAGEPEWRRRINQAIGRHGPEITAILAEYGVPQLDAQGRPATP